MGETGKLTDDGQLILKNEVKLPEILDVLIVGGGPGGTAAAFRAKELGLSALVIDFDDILKRIRDYAKDKLILPSFGGGDKMKFPAGGDLVSMLQFEPIDKDDMHKQWRSWYAEKNIPAHIGAELTGLERQADGVWAAKTWNHTNKSEHVYQVRHVVISIGRGQPRRFDVPGNTDGIAYRLSDPVQYVGHPVCVVGGGTSAAEAVIAISHAKAKAEDKTGVYWSHRGQNMPLVSKALADVLFDAHIGNGNIRFCPGSEVLAVVSGDDRLDYVSLRVDRKRIEGRPFEVAHFEFRKEFCVACIGEDLPEKFLNSMGIYMATGGPANKKRMIVKRTLETQQPNVFLVGDILSQAYFQTEDFSADPATFEEVKHRGNIKSALRDGVFVADVIKARLEGKSDAEVSLVEADTSAPPAAPKEVEKPISVVVEAEGPPEESVAPERQVTESQAYLVRMLAGDVQDDEYMLKPDGVTTIGRQDCDISFNTDNLLSDRHASISRSGDNYVLRDDGSRNGVFLRATEGRPLEAPPGSIIRVGRQFLVVAGDNGSFGFVHYDSSGKEIGRHKITDKMAIVGREAPDVTLDGADKTLSRRHLALGLKQGRVHVKDLKSVNGTYLKVNDTVHLQSGDRFRVGQQELTFMVRDEAVVDTAHTLVEGAATPSPAPTPAAKAAPQPQPAPAQPAPSPPPAPAPKAAPAPQPAAATGEPQVTFKKLGKTIEVQAGQSICEAAEANGVPIDAECHAGMCGSDPIRIHSGHENLNALTDAEKDTIEDLCGLDPSQCRMACMVRPTGPVEVDLEEE